MAITFLTGDGAQGNVNSLTKALDCTGASILIARVWTVGDDCTGVTYAGAAMTLIGSAYQYNAGEYLSIYYKVSPTTGSNNAVASFSSTGVCAMRIGCFSGTSTTSIPDSVHNDAGGPGNTATGVTTSVADSCMGVMIARFEDGSPTAAGGSNFASSSGMGDAAGSYAILGYSAIKTPAGSISMVAKSSGSSGVWGARIISLAPPSAGGPANLKTYNTNTKANIKTINTNTLANCKTLDTNA